MTINRRADKRTEELEAELAALEQGRQPEPPTEPVAVETPPEPPADVIELSPEEKTWKKRHGDLRRHTQTVEKELRDEINKLKEALTKSDTSDLTKEQVKKWAETNPQANVIIRAIAEEQAGLKTNEIKTKFAEIDEINAELSRGKAEAKVRKVHSDFDDIVASNEFHAWAETQPEFIQDKIYDNPNADDTIWAISLYKRETKSPNTERETAKAVKTSKTSPTPVQSKGRFTESMVSKMSPAEFEKNQDAILEEMRTNPSFYDLSGGAR